MRSRSTVPTGAVSGAEIRTATAAGRPQGGSGWRRARGAGGQRAEQGEGRPGVPERRVGATLRRPAAFRRRLSSRDNSNSARVDLPQFCKAGAGGGPPANLAKRAGGEKRARWTSRCQQPPGIQRGILSLDGSVAVKSRQGAPARRQAARVDVDRAPRSGAAPREQTAIPAVPPRPGRRPGCAAASPPPRGARASRAAGRVCGARSPPVGVTSRCAKGRRNSVGCVTAI